MSSPREHLAALLAPVGIEEFLASVWEQRALHIPGNLRKFEGWDFDVDALRDMLEDHPDLSVKAQYHDPQGHHREVEVEPDQAFALFDAGLTICFQSIEGCHDPLRELAVACKTYLNLAERFFINCYWSPGSGGFGMHLDRFSVLIVQLDGTKHWTYSETPAIPFPMTNFTDIPEGRRVFPAVFPWLSGPPPFPEGCRLAEQTLAPGDALYLPAGTWHRARAEGSSLALTLTFVHRRFDSLLPAILAAKLNGDADWRAPVPPVPLESTPVCGLPAEVEAFFAARIAQVKAAVDTLTPGDLAHIWRTEVGRYDFEVVDTGSEGAATSGRPVAIDHGTSFDVPRPVFCVAVPEQDADAGLHVFFADRHITLPLSSGAFIEHLSHHAHFRAADALHWADDGTALAWDEVAEALGALLAAGVISLPS